MGWHLPGYTPPWRALSPSPPPLPWPVHFALRASTWNWFLELHCRGSALTWGLGLAVGGGVTVHSHCETLAFSLMREHAGACRSLSVNNPDRTTGGRTRFTFTAYAKPWNTVKAREKCSTITRCAHWQMVVRITLIFIYLKQDATGKNIVYALVNFESLCYWIFIPCCFRVVERNIS